MQALWMARTTSAYAYLWAINDTRKLKYISVFHFSVAVFQGGLKCHLIPDGMRAWRACTADYGHASRSTWFRGIPDAPNNHSGRPGDRVWPRFPLILGSGGLKTALGVFPACRPQFFDFF